MEIQYDLLEELTSMIVDLTEENENLKLELAKRKDSHYSYEEFKRLREAVMLAFAESAADKKNPTKDAWSLWEY